MLPFLDKLEKLTSKSTAQSGFRLPEWPILILGAMILLVSFIFMPKVVSLALSLALFIAPLWLPALLLGGAWGLWIAWRRSEFIAAQEMILLEIKPPRNLIKTPLAMETFFSGIHLSPGEGTWYVRWIKGGVRPWWSLEIASIEGQVHFFIWTRTFFRSVIETQLYAQYPSIQITEAPDYTRFADLSLEKWGSGIWGCDFIHTDPDPLPIKTYVEYGLDKIQKEEEQTDPLANLIEFMGSMGKGEQLWLQIMIRVHKGEKYHKLKDNGKPFDWKDEAKDLVKKMREETRMPYTDPVSGKEVPGFPNPTKGQMEKIAAIERNVTKPAFDVGIRGIYLVNADQKFRVVNLFALMNIFKQFSSEGWNGIKAGAGSWMMQFDDYPWEIGTDKLKNKIRTALVEAYRRRQYFHPPFTFGFHPDKAMVMSTEELATIFHIPSRAIETPSLGRIQSATSEAPVNLPV
ncbi:MAG: hypothetical protein WC798_00450 [Candidatus Paceibacterota bacterium]|jgi:hypothetical protein